MGALAMSFATAELKSTGDAPPAPGARRWLCKLKWLGPKR